jgi:RNA polymerase sigma-70 factor (sigma-E family)
MVVGEVESGIDVADLFRQHHVGLVRLALLLVDDVATAEDVVQEVFANLHRHAGRLREPAAAVAYLRRSTVNGSRSVLRRRRTARAYLRVAEPDAGEAADAPALLAAEHAEVLIAVRTLPRRDQEVLVLRYWSNCTDAEIAAALGIAAGTVRSTASRAIAKLERILEVQR